MPRLVNQRRIMPPGSARVVVCLVWLIPLTPMGWASSQQEYELNDGQWKQTITIDPDTPQGQVHQIRVALADDEPAKAVELADQWIEDHPGHELLAQVYVLRGDAKVANRDYYKALYDYEYVIREFPASDQFVTAQQREYEVARLFASGVKRRFIGMRLLSANDEVEEILIRIQERAPGSALGESASLLLGDFYFDRKQMGKAAVAYEMFLVNYTQSTHRQHVMQRLIQASLATFEGPSYDATGLIEAIQRIKDFEDEFPMAAQQFQTAQLLTTIEESLAAKMLANAQWYDRRGQAVSAAYLYRQVIQRYSQTPAAHRAVARLTELDEPIQVSTSDTPTVDPASPAGHDTQRAADPRSSGQDAVDGVPSPSPAASRSQGSASGEAPQDRGAPQGGREPVPSPDPSP